MIEKRYVSKVEAKQIPYKVLPVTEATFLPLNTRFLHTRRSVVAACTLPFIWSPCHSRPWVLDDTVRA